jgi:hypothetical protein
MLRTLANAEEEKRKATPTSTSVDQYLKARPPVETAREGSRPARPASVNGNIAAELDRTIGVIQRLKERVSRVSEEYRSSFPRIDSAGGRLAGFQKAGNERDDLDAYNDFSIEELEELIFAGRAAG